MLGGLIAGVQKARGSSHKWCMGKIHGKSWLQQHINDPYVKLAQRAGYRSRACYKLLEIQDKYQLICPGMTVVDLGCAPGGWSQIAASLIGSSGKIIAIDRLSMSSISGVTFIQGDFAEETTWLKVLSLVGDNGVDLVISDMAPNISGIRVADQASAMALVELALDLAKRALKPGGTFLTKVFQGEGFDSLLGDVRTCFKQVKSCKPSASRPRSREVYWLARGFVANDSWRSAR